MSKNAQPPKPSTKRKRPKPEPAKRKRGRPSKFDERYVGIARKAARMGATNEDLAEYFAVNPSTIDDWIASRPEFSGAIKEGRSDANARVERALFERACGYEHDDIDIRTIAIGDGRSEIVQTPVRRYFAPDTTACIFWTKNRMPDRWRDKIQHEHSGIDFALILAQARKRAS
jgi:hypothetical protein